MVTKFVIFKIYDSLGHLKNEWISHLSLKLHLNINGDFYCYGWHVQNININDDNYGYGDYKITFDSMVHGKFYKCLHFHTYLEQQNRLDHDSDY